MVGALVAGVLADRFGRRSTILIAALTFSVGALVEAVAPGSGILVAGRLIVGFGVGVASVAAPLYAAESAPTHVRGRLVSLYQMAITIGIFIAYFADYLLIESDSWRAMLGISAIPAVLLLLVMLRMKDSPRWYVTAGRDQEAAAVLARVEPGGDTDAQLAAVKAAVEQEPAGTWKDVFAREWRAPLIVGVALAFLQQLTGINAIIYYADNIFAAAGFNSPVSQSLATLWAIGAVNVLATLIAVLYVDRFGRKPLLMIGSAGMCLSLIVVGGAFVQLDDVTASNAHAGAPSSAGLIALVGLVVFIASFAFSLGPVVWTIINEIFPAHVRGKGVAVATGANWFAAWLVSQFFLTLVDILTEQGTFWLFAAFSAGTYVYVRVLVPETKGKSLEEVQEMWSNPAALAAARADRG
jgi:sugar porter (SP) family MFS transporter